MTNKSLRDYINLIETAQQGVAEDADSWFRVTVKTPNGKNHNIQVPANSHGTAKRKALAYCAKNGIAGAEFVSAMRMPTLDEQGVAEAAKWRDPKNKDAEPVKWTGPKKGDYGYTGYQGHGMPTDKQERDRIRADKKKAQGK
jgi:hypothetical protein